MRGRSPGHPSAWLIGLVLLAGCTTDGDFGRLRSSLVRDDMHDWIGREAARRGGYPHSSSSLTDDERQLRDLAYSLIEPPFDRGRWDRLLLQYGAGRFGPPHWPPGDRTVYGAQLLRRPYRSAAARYARLIDDIRDDIVRIAPFAAVARRVADMDIKRQRSLAYVSALSADERTDAESRIAENAMIVRWVYDALTRRAAAYRYALERCVIDTPSPMAVDAERALNALHQRLSDNRLAAALPPIDPRGAQARA